MSQKRPPLFKLDLRVDKKMIKLKVHEEDSLSDLIQRLQASISWKEIASEKVRLRLEQQFRKIMEQQTLSTQVKDKLNELMEESKVVIVGIDTGSNNNTFNETPFKILQESLVNLSKDRKSAKSHYHYLDQPSLHINYGSAEVVQTGNVLKDHFNSIQLKPRQPNQQKFDYLQAPEDNFDTFQRKYEAVDRKCQQFITKHEDIKDSYNQYRIGKNQPDLGHQAKTVACREPQQPVVSQYRDYNERINQSQPLTVNQNRFNRNYNNVYQAEKKQNKGETFQNYKVSRNISHPNLSGRDGKDGKQASQQVVHPYREPHLQRQLSPGARSPVKLSYQQQNLKPLSRDYGKVQQFPLSANPPGQPRKFNYFRQQQ